MLNIELIRREPDRVRRALEARGEADSLDSILALDRQRRQRLQEIEEQRAQQNKLSRLVGRAKAARTPTDLGKVLDEAKALGYPLEGIGLTHDAVASWLIDKAQQAIPARVQKLESNLEQVEAELQNLLLALPNIPREDVPVGMGEANNRIVRTWGQPRAFDFTPLPHWELGERLGIIDFERGVKLAGSRFFVLKGLGAKLERALINWMLDNHVQEHGYTEVYPPFLVKGECLVGSGNLPKFGDNLYRDAEEDLWLIPTAEVPLTNLHREEILAPGTLPLHYVAYTPCFRREKAAAGRDTRGIKRVHQFDKVELYKFVEPDKSDQELERLVADAEDMCRRLGIPYRVVQLCTGELGFASAKTYDIEMWAPGSGEWLEVSSCSNCTDFQARRAGIRYRPAAGARPEFVHTLNGSGVALPRTLIAILENYQQADGSVLLPEALRPLMGVETIHPGKSRR
ncbi:MAG: serine--tRNA ligase [Chloroflexi bacterium]|nr:serine--tRNA ligase [Chloroflexota bacterium]